MALISAWAEAWDALEPEFLAAVLSVLGDTPAGRVTVRRIARARRVAAAIRRAREEITRLLDQYTDTVQVAVPEAVTATVTAHQDMTIVQLPENHGLDLTGLAGRQMDRIVHRCMEQITTAHLRLPETVEQELRRALIRGVTVGDNPNRVAARLVKDAGKAFAGGLPRATMIVRTEMLDACRSAAQAWEQANPNVVDGWTWVAALDRRTCPACIAMHGTEHPASEPGPIDHHNGRCARAPRTKPWAELGLPNAPEPAPHPTGPEWFAAQPEDVQNTILGPGRAALIRDGDATLHDMVTRRHNQDWRDSITTTPLKALKRKAQ
ncbi:phage minor head protein [Rothia koreensis]|uniref:phage minor head protein n=1 Tax=Rothia koreensis TaxID=592378 RepID=UPI0037CA4471